LAGRQAEAARACAREIAARTGLALQEGDMVEELRTPGPSKGDSVRAFMSLPPFKGATPVFVGDDATDEDGFEAAQALGGVGVAVGNHRAVNAGYRLAGVEAALAWLEAAL
jgi:trehalose 6-phosphate phosphatase